MSIAPISVQLYSLREQAAHDFASVLRHLGEVGFVGVELAGFNNLTPVEFSSVAKDAGLVVSSAHLGSGPGFASALADVQSVGCSTIIVPFLPPDHFADIDAVKRSADIVNESAAIAHAAGATCGYHNHWWEFETIIDGRSAFDHLYDMLDPAVFIELDTYWTKVGGADPVDVITRYGDRVRLVHVKDGPADESASSMVAVGSGAMPIVDILGAAKHADWHVVELDRCDTDMATAVAQSYAYLVNGGLSRGRK